MRKLVVALVALATSVRQARADGSPDASYLYDGGAVPLFWLPLVGSLVVAHEVPPRTTPFRFDAHDGGAPPSSWEVPGWSLGIVGVGVATAFAAGSDPSRWYHAKGLVESMATASLAVEILKPVVGRHRPDWSSTATDPTESESFPSGHATEAFVIATYTALYLHDHVSGEHALAYAGLFTAAGLVGAERVYHHRHHVSDVVVGSLLGVVTSFAIYHYQDASARDHRVSDDGAVPSIGPNPSSLSVTGSF
jgi:membrane-associated phospholipid phosphatase